MSIRNRQLTKARRIPNTNKTQRIGTRRIRTGQQTRTQNGRRHHNLTGRTTNQGRSTNRSNKRNLKGRSTRYNLPTDRTRNRTHVTLNLQRILRHLLGRTRRSKSIRRNRHSNTKSSKMLPTRLRQRRRGTRRTCSGKKRQKRHLSNNKNSITSKPVKHMLSRRSHTTWASKRQSSRNGRRRVRQIRRLMRCTTLNSINTHKLHRRTQLRRHQSTLRRSMNRRKGSSRRSSNSSYHRRTHNSTILFLSAPRSHLISVSTHTDRRPSPPYNR